VVAERFPGGYDYVGVNAADIRVGRNAREVIAVAPSAATLRKAKALGKPTTVIEGNSRTRALIKASRLHQWAKNTLIFVPAVLSGTIIDPSALKGCLLAFVALGLVAVGTYLINDVLDIAHDRHHWSKRFRPIASGDLQIGTALAAAVVAIVGGFAIGAAAGLSVLAGLAAYLVLTLAYSIHIKRVPILDVVVLATLFTLRLAIGIAAAGVFASPWLLVFSMALFTSLSIAKRNTEIQRTAAKGETDVPGRGYVAADAPLMLGLGLATGTASVLILVLFLIFDAFERDIYTNPHWLWLFPVVIFLWIGRIWLISQRGELNDDPVAFALKDRQSLALGAIMVVAFILAWAGVPP
jgi:4-hydroxybenzoate polyprenyltransferase